jgi:hypothetical protein
VTGDPTEPAEQTSPADGKPPVEEGDATGLPESAEPTEPPEVTGGEGQSLSSQALADPVLDPRAFIGDLDCADLTIPVTLDNTRSTGPVAFYLFADPDPSTEESYFESTELLSAGAIKAIQIPVIDGKSAYMEISASDPSDEYSYVELVALWRDVQCAGDRPRISIGDVDCSTLTVPVTLDNSRSITHTSFVVGTFSGEDSWEETVAVPAGETRVIQVEVTDVTNVQVYASNNSPGALGPFTSAQILVRCKLGETLPTAAIGEIDCRTRTIPVTIDSSDTEVVIGVEVSAYVPAPDDDEPLWSDDADLDAVPGEIRIVRVGPVALFIVDVVPVYVVNTEAQSTLDDHVIAKRDVPIDCPRTAARPTVAVESTKLAQTGGFNLALPLLGLALVAGGSGMLALTASRPRN